MKNKAFTLVELMIVVIIIGVLVAMVVPNMIGRSEQARISVARADIDVNIATAIKLYDADTGTLPKTLDDLVVSPGDENGRGRILIRCRLIHGKSLMYTKPRVNTGPRATT